VALVIGDRRLGRVFYAVIVPLGGILSAALAPSQSSGVTRFMYGLGGLWLGWVATVLALSAVVTFTPYRYTLHWYCQEDYRGVQQSGTVAPAVVLELVSECDHRVNGLQCEIIRRGGEPVIALPHVRQQFSDFNSGLIGTGQPLSVNYPGEFRVGEVWFNGDLAPDTYEVRWTSLVHNGEKRVIVAKQKLVIIPELLGP
jgi:hypothetical protein